MFIILLRFSANKPDAPQHMTAHNDWIKRGLEAGVFLTVGSLAPNAGGAILAHGETRAELEARVALDPFVTHDIVSAEVLEFSAAKTDPRLAFLTGD